MTHIMLDLETLGSDSYSVVPAIGAVKFDENGVNDSFYYKLSVQEQIDSGLSVKESTLKWWFTQSDKARQELFERQVSTTFALHAFAHWIKEKPKDTYIWGKGATFDNVLLSNLYDAFEMQQPWRFRNNRCYRTVINMYPDIEPDEYLNLEAHVAVDDAIYQAGHLIKIIEQTDMQLG